MQQSHGYKGQGPSIPDSADEIQILQTLDFTQDEAAVKWAWNNRPLITGQPVTASISTLSILRDTRSWSPQLNVLSWPWLMTFSSGSNISATAGETILQRIRRAFGVALGCEALSNLQSDLVQSGWSENFPGVKQQRRRWVSVRVTVCSGAEAARCSKQIHSRSDGHSLSLVCRHVSATWYLLPAFAVLHTTHLFTVTRCRRRVITPPPQLVHTQRAIYGSFSFEAVQGDELSLWLNVVKTETKTNLKKKTHKKKNLLAFPTHLIYSQITFLNPIWKFCDILQLGPFSFPFFERLCD